jgi:hypothetical protein
MRAWPAVRWRPQPLWKSALPTALEIDARKPLADMVDELAARS